MTGNWRCSLTHGQIIDTKFKPGSADLWGIQTSTSQLEHPAQDAFDGKAATRWCADSPSYPQWINADMGQTRHITGISLAWEATGQLYRYRIEGSLDGKKWFPLVGETTASADGFGQLAVSGGDARFVRLTVLNNASGGWASLREIAIHYAGAAGDMEFRPVKHKVDTLHIDDFALPNYDDTSWKILAVPSNWEIAGYSLPTYNSVDDTVGLYRRWVNVPAAFKGRRTYWRFDGAMDGAEVFVNGKRAGYHESGFTAFDVDITNLLKPGMRNLFAVRVSKMTPSVDCETGDFQCMGGIYRDTSLISVPQTHISDVTVRTPLSTNYEDATFQEDVVVHGSAGASVALTGYLVGVDGHRLPVNLSGTGLIDTAGTAKIALSAEVTSPKLWSAEKPNLYYSVLAISVGGKLAERVEQRFGFRQVEFKNNVLLWNGRPIKCEGTCRHDFWADKGFALTDKEWNQDLTMMKNANINAIRTSHYNHAARFLELCEEKGFYILDEVPFCWINDKNNDPSFAPALLSRAADTLGRDKNRPCVLAWSLGNENGVGKNSQTVIDYVKALDPTRPAFISQAGFWGPKGQSFQDMHYPSPQDVDNYVKNDSSKLPAQFSEQPHIMYQKDAQEYDPGTSDLWTEVLQSTWDKIWKSPTIVGSYVWEWQNQGVADKNKDHSRDFWYGQNRLRQENDKGIVTAYRVPKPELWIVKMVYSPVVIGAKTVSPANGQCGVPLTNRYSFTNLNELSCNWQALRGQTMLAQGRSTIQCGPGEQCDAHFPAPLGMTALRLEFDRADRTSVTMALLSVDGSPAPSPPAAFAAGDPLKISETTGTIAVSNNLQSILVNRNTGEISSWTVNGKQLINGGPILNIGQGYRSDEKGYFSGSLPPTISAVTAAAAVQTDGSAKITITGNIAAYSPIGSFSCDYTVNRNAEIKVAWSLNWTSSPTKLWESGLKLSVPAELSRMTWSRDSYYSVYPAGHIGEPLGSCNSKDTLFAASKRNLHWMTLTDASGIGLALLQDSTPLIGRAQSGKEGITLLASSGLAGPHDFSYEWIKPHDIDATTAKSISGSFILRAIGPSVVPANVHFF